MRREAKTSAWAGARPPPRTSCATAQPSTPSCDWWRRFADEEAKERRKLGLKLMDRY
jgi:hypothetical protein